MKIFLGLFTNLDSIITDYDVKKFRESRKKIGGNAGNSAIILSELGIPCVPSCPVRPKSIMDILDGYKGNQGE